MPSGVTKKQKEKKKLPSGARGMVQCVLCWTCICRLGLDPQGNRVLWAPPGGILSITGHGEKGRKGREGGERESREGKMKGGKGRKKGWSFPGTLSLGLLLR